MSIVRALLLFEFICLLFSIPAISQVVNDNIANRIRLHTNRPVTSTTVGCTVEWTCVDEKLTGKCIKYHNDQWFYFNVDSGGTYYLNVSGQHCRDLFGVQVVVIDGTPCDISTYHTVDCYSTGSQDDVFIKIDSLKPGRDYLLNVDGYLHDFCSFTLELSKEAKGLPRDLSPNGKVRLTQTKTLNILKWSLSADSADRISHFEIWRRSSLSSKSVLVSSVDVKRNTKGETQLAYSFEDSTYAVAQHYKIVGVGQASRFLYSNVLTKDDSIQADNSEINNIKLELQYGQNTPISILIFDDLSGRLLQNAHFNFDRKKDAQLTYYVGELRKKGIHFFRVEVIDNRNKNRNVFRFSK